jgi:hypothetical protein
MLTRRTSIRFLVLVSVFVAGGAIAAGLPGLGLYPLLAPFPLAVLGLGICTLVLTRNPALRAPSATLRQVLHVAVGIALGVWAGKIAGSFLQDRLFWHYAPAYEDLVTHTIELGQAGFVPLKGLPLPARWCCRTDPLVYQIEGGPATQQYVASFDMAPDHLYRFEVLQGAPGQTYYYGASPSAATALPQPTSDAIMPPCDSTGLRYRWCRMALPRAE